MDAVESLEGPTQTIERLTGVYRVLKPHLVAVYERHLGRRQPGVRAADPAHPGALPEDERRHAPPAPTSCGSRADEALPGAAHAWERRVLDVLTAAGGVTGDVEPPPSMAAGAGPDPAVGAQDLVPLPPPFDPRTARVTSPSPIEAHCRALVPWRSSAAVLADLAPETGPEAAAAYAAPAGAGGAGARPGGLRAARPPARGQAAAGCARGHGWCCRQRWVPSTGAGVARSRRSRPTRRRAVR